LSQALFINPAVVFHSEHESTDHAAGENHNWEWHRERLLAIMIGSKPSLTHFTTENQALKNKLVVYE
jgi:hypothetical protein